MYPEISCPFAFLVRIKMIDCTTDKNSPETYRQLSISVGFFSFGERLEEL
jgi:hypothetical protein